MTDPNPDTEGKADGAEKHGQWVRQWTEPPARHYCRRPRPDAAHAGDLWRCVLCGRLSMVEAYRLVGVSPSSPMQYRWVRPPLLTRIVFHNMMPSRDGQWLALGALVVLAIAGVGAIGERLGWWS